MARPRTAITDHRAAQAALRRVVEANKALQQSETDIELMRQQCRAERADAIADARSAGMTLALIAESLRVSTERVRQMASDTRTTQ